jgi:putative NIF3 family GTP cyclohydrolase 1 type 2
LSPCSREPVFRGLTRYLWEGSRPWPEASTVGVAMVQVRDVMGALAEVFPFQVEGRGGPSGLLVGSAGAPVTRVLCSVELSRPVMEAAAATSSELLVTHRPHLLLQAGAPLDVDTPGGAVAAAAVEAGVNVVGCCGGADAADGGTADIAARRLKLQDCLPLKVPETVYTAKIVVFVPGEALEAVFEAMVGAGAGASDRYTRASFRSEGTGTFFPGDKALPYAGEKGELNLVRETRLEMACDSWRVPAVLRAMLAEHPYEEVAYDVYRTESQPPCGQGRIGDLPEPTRMSRVMEDMAEWSSSEDVTLAGDPGSPVVRVAVAPGTGDDLVEPAWRAGAEALITGELTRGAALEARESGMSVLTLGCVESERAVVGAFVEVIKGASEAHGWGLEVEGYRDWRGIWG